MAAQHKISIRKIIQTLVTLILVAGVVMAMKRADHQFRGRKIKEVQISIQKPSGVGFVDEASVREQLFENRHFNPLQEAASSVDEHTLESILISNPWIENAQVYTDANRVMHIILTQRVPVARIFEQDGNSYYLDHVLQVMPISNHYTHYTPVVTGVPQLHKDSASLILKGKIVGLVNRLGKNSFWSAQIAQIDINEDGEFELIPVLGSQRIILGDTTRLDAKLAKLLAFYKQIQNKVGWDKYTKIDLRFKDQVVASPSLPWKRPKDAAFTNMSWLTAIMETAQKTESGPGGEAGKDVETPNAEGQGATKTPKTEKMPAQAAPASSEASVKAKKQEAATAHAAKPKQNNNNKQEKNTKAHVR
ncbi:MAG: hypothetical protein JST36_06920 [Bacteroidetes bacterium]|nr:hypothetical protein [Bacteroidota bacterium]